MFIDQELTELAWELGAALRHRAAMSGLHRDNPSSATKSWLQKARWNVRELQERERRLGDALRRHWEAA